MAQTRTANGNIPFSVFVTSVGQSAFEAAVCGATDQPIGISQEGSRYAPGTPSANSYAAEDGQQFTLYGDYNDRALLIPGATWSAGSLIKPMAGGLGTPVTWTATEQLYGARALEACTSDDLAAVSPRQVEVMFGQINPGTTTTSTTTTTTTV